MSEEETPEVGIFVLPTQDNMPPRATLMQDVPAETVPEDVRELVEETGIEMKAVARELVTWSRDAGTWLDQSGVPVPQEVADAITEHAKNLGVEW